MLVFAFAELNLLAEKISTAWQPKEIGSLMTSRTKFEDLIYSRLIPDLCENNRLNMTPDGFQQQSIKISENDAEDFLRAWHMGLARHLGDGRYLFGNGHKKEQFFWEGRRNIRPRRFTLWQEPVITLCALGRLHTKHDWPIDYLVSQSDDDKFDLVTTKKSNIISGEIKKTRSELDSLMKYMIEFGQYPSATEPPSGKVLNAFRKVVSLRQFHSEILWLVGPDRHEYVFEVQYQNDGVITFNRASTELLRFSN